MEVSIGRYRRIWFYFSKHHLGPDCFAYGTATNQLHLGFKFEVQDLDFQDLQQ